MKIVVVSAFYSEGMGYTENCLPKVLASLGHEVYVITSNMNVYGTSPDYHKTYELFLGPADQGQGMFLVDGYVVHRMSSSVIFGYVYIKDLVQKVKEINPDIVHSIEIASLQTFALAIAKPFSKFKFFAETHQHLSVVRPFLKTEQGFFFQKLFYKLTRTLPTFLASLAVKKCYAISPDCAEVAINYYGVPKDKIVLQSLGTDTELFGRVNDENASDGRSKFRKTLGYSDDDIVCIYTGRFSVDKNPLLLARAIDVLAKDHPSFHGLFIGEGPQKDQIEILRNCKILPFMKHKELAQYYHASDIAVWPTQESMSMLDAAACGLPLVVSNRMGESERIIDNGMTYDENNLDSLVKVISSLLSKTKRQALGTTGRNKMIDKFSWNIIGKKIESDFQSDLQ